MIEATQLAGLGFTIPDWIKKAAGAVIRGTIVTVPTPVGYINVDLGDPASLEAAKRIITGTRVSTTIAPRAPVQPSPVQQVNAAVSQLPGGWLTIAALAALGLFVLPRVLPRSRG